MSEKGKRPMPNFGPSEYLGWSFWKQLHPSVILYAEVTLKTQTYMMWLQAQILLHQKMTSKLKKD